MSRSLTRNVFIEASPDIVWRALTAPKELSRWLSVDARIEPGVGGTIALSWGDGADGAASITAWEADRRFQWTEDSGGSAQTVDFTLEARAGCTAVRVVEAGFGHGSDADSDMATASGSWSYFLQHLKWYVEKHVGTPRQLLAWREPVSVNRDDAFNRLLGPLGLSTDDTLVARGAGDVYESTTSSGDKISGIVIARGIDTCQIGLTISELNNAILFVEVEDEDPGSRPGFWLSTYGLDKKTLAGARERFGNLYRSALELEKVTLVAPVTSPVTAKA